MHGSCQIQAPLAVLDAVSNDITKIDRMDRRALFTSHYTRDGKRTLCGLTLEVTQSWCDNGFCRRCEKIAARCQNQTPHGVSK
jgi:hypothetical protein